MKKTKTKLRKVSKGMIGVLTVGVWQFKGKTFPWRLLETGMLQIFDEKTGRWYNDVELSKSFSGYHSRKFKK